MRELVKGGVLLMIVSSLVALIHSCSIDSDSLRPTCLITEVDLDEKWWYPQHNPAEPALYFRINGLLNIEGQSDSLSFTLENCNKIRVTNISGYAQELWVIKSIGNSELSIEYPSKGIIAYLRTR